MGKVGAVIPAVSLLEHCKKLGKVSVRLRWSVGVAGCLNTTWSRLKAVSSNTRIQYAVGHPRLQLCDLLCKDSGKLVYTLIFCTCHSHQ